MPTIRQDFPSHPIEFQVTPAIDVIHAPDSAQTV